MNTLRALLSDLAAAIALGALASLAHPGLDLFPCAVVALSGLSFVITRRDRWLNAIVCGYLFGAVVFCVTTIGALSWGWNVPVSLSLGGALGSGAPLGTWIWLTSRRLQPGARFVATAAAWGLAMDAADAVGFPLNWPATAAVSAWPLSMAGARWCGANTLGGILVAGAICAGVELATLPARAAWRRALITLGSSFALLLALGIAARLSGAKGGGALQVGVPQLNIPSNYFPARQALPGKTEAFEAAFAEQLAELRGVDLLALTESFDGRFGLEVPVSRAGFQRYARLERQAVLLTSYLVAPDGGGYNAVAGIAPSGELVGVHRKVDLAPFGESDLKAGERFRALPLWPELKVGAMICQESAPPRAALALTRDGAQLLVATTSDTSFKSSVVVFQHLALTKLRAIETGRSIVWASASGPSGGIDRWGRFSAAAPLRVARSTRFSVDVFGDQTLFVSSARIWPFLRIALLALLALRRRVGPRVFADPLANSRAATARGTAATLSAALLCALLAIVGPPAVLEWRYGTPERAWSSLLEPWRDPADLDQSISYERFRTGAGRSAEGALAFYLDFYGPSRTASEVQLTRRATSLADLLDYLRDVAHFPGRLVTLRWDQLPRAATLVRGRDGNFAVLTANGYGAASLFSPLQAQPLALPSSEVARFIEAQGILPLGLPDTASPPP